MPDLVDLRSDTVTRPTAAMRRAMAEAEVGDDDYGEDPTVRALEETFAARVGKPAALFVASGVMANQIAIRVLTRPGTAVVAGRRQHVVAYEYGAAAMNAGIQFIELDDDDGMLRADDVRRARDAAAHHQPDVSLVCLEHTHMAASGAPWTAAGLRAVIDASGPVPVHMDGARLFNAEAATGVRAEEWAAAATTVMCCLSKGLCAPVGSVLAGEADVIAAGRLARKRLGGGMRQAGVLAAPGLVALSEMVERLPEDHLRARRLADAVADLWPGCGLDPDRVRTNIVTFTHPEPDKLLAHLEGHGVLAHAIAPETVRFVTHHDVDDAGVSRAIAALAGGTGKRRMKVRIGISGGGESLGPDAMVALARAISETGFDSLWLPEVLTRPGPDPLVGLAWASGACPGLKIGTTMLLPGRNLVWLAKAVATLDVLSGGRFLLTFVPGLAIGGERSAIGIPPAERGVLMDEALPVLRRLWAGEEVTHEGHAGSFAGVSVSPRPVQDPFDVWLGGNVPAALERCGRLADGWIPAFCTPADAAAGKAVIDKVAAEYGRAISPEHFGVSLAYAPEGTDLAALASTPLARRARGRPLEQIVPVGLGGLREIVEQFLEVGFSKFIVRPMAPPEQWRSELERLAGAVGGLQT